MARRPVTSASMLSEFQNGHCGATKAGEQTVNRLLSSALSRRRLPPVHFEKAIFTQVAGGLVAHTAAARGHLRRRAYPVGVLVNTMPLFDPITGVGLAPGAVLVELRPILGGEFAFDFVVGDGRTRFSTPASLSSAGQRGLELTPADRPISATRFSLLDIDIMDGSDPDDPLPPGSGIVLCISFLHWVKCWVHWLPGPTVPQGPILV
jgi:hypothetical protein